VTVISYAAGGLPADGLTAARIYLVKHGNTRATRCAAGPSANEWGDWDALIATYLESGPPAVVEAMGVYQPTLFGP
jgi:hypothetical protein